MGKAKAAGHRSASQPAAVEWDGSGDDPAAPIRELAGKYVKYLLATDAQLPSNGAGERFPARGDTCAGPAQQQQQQHGTALQAMQQQPCKSLIPDSFCIVWATWRAVAQLF